MPKYVQMLTPADMRRIGDEDPEAKQFFEERQKDAGGTHFACPMRLTLPKEVEAWIKANEDESTQKNAMQAFGVFFMECAEMLIPSLPDEVRARIQPKEALGVLADEVVMAVYAVPFEKAGVEGRAEYTTLAHMVVNGLGRAGVSLAAAMVCAKTHGALVALADGREALPEIDPALAAKATHKDHATVQ